MSYSGFKLDGETIREQAVLESPRLMLRPFRESDAAEVQRLAGDKRIADVTLHIPHPYPDGAAEQWIASHTEAWLKANRISYAICLKETGALIGTTAVMNIRGGDGELGYWIGVPYWGRGYCAEASQLLIEYAFHSFGLSRIHASHLARNPASGRVLAKVGMTHLGNGMINFRDQSEQERVEHFELMYPNKD